MSTRCPEKGTLVDVPCCIDNIPVIGLADCGCIDGTVVDQAWVEQHLCHKDITPLKASTPVTTVVGGSEQGVYGMINITLDVGNQRLDVKANVIKTDPSLGYPIFIGLPEWERLGWLPNFPKEFPGRHQDTQADKKVITSGQRKNTKVRPKSAKVHRRSRGEEATSVLPPVSLHQRFEVRLQWPYLLHIFLESDAARIL